MPPGIMKARSTAIAAAHLANRPQVRAAPKRVHSPSCTHVTMDRVFVGKGAQCFACGHAPSLGFLYECREYCSPVPHSVLSEPDVIDGGGSQKSSLRRELEEIGMSESVIAAAEGGHYTTQELAQLKCSKSRLNWAVTAAIHRAQSANARAHLTGTGGATNGTAGGDVVRTFYPHHGSLGSLTLLSCRAATTAPATHADRTLGNAYTSPLGQSSPIASLLSPH